MILFMASVIFGNLIRDYEIRKLEQRIKILETQPERQQQSNPTPEL